MFGFLEAIVGPVALIVASLIIRSIKNPTDRDRASLLSTIANAAAALVVSKNPTAPWANLLADVIREISTAAGLPTQNAKAIERAAAEALAAQGVKPR